jgi:hypothetical protein
MRAAKTIENGFERIVRRDIGPTTLARRPDERQQKTHNPLDRAAASRHCQGAMTNAPACVPSEPTPLVSIVIFILPL